MLKDSIGIPSLTLKYLFTTIPETTYFSLFSNTNKDIHSLFRSNLVGDPSIIFHRYHEAGVTHLRNENGKIVRSIVGYDANALYLKCITENMPTGTPTIYRKDKDFRPQSNNFYNMSQEFLSYMSFKDGVHIISKFNGKERRVGGRLVDGYCQATNTVYQFHGCYWHGHQKCPKLKKAVTGINEKRGKTFKEINADTRAFSKKLREEVGVTLIEMYECEWEGMKKRDKHVQQFMDTHFALRIQKQTFWNLSLYNIPHLVMTDQLFGAVLCSIEVPDKLMADGETKMRDYFSEMTPIFKNDKVGRENLEPFMLKYCQDNNVLRQPRRTLIGSYYGKDILLSTPLLKWYLEKGLELTDVKIVIQFTPEKCFENFGANVSNARREGDIDKSKSIISDSMKLIGNSSYGKVITDVKRFTTVQYLSNERKASEAINEKRFKGLQELAHDVYEVEMAKKTVSWNLPLHIVFFVYQDAKKGNA